ncbi:hypothetical protein MTR67_004651 [Solanum verrucosum]|uniref:Uncharacterized protein n=1 Tax=Solanum verrucosum TaxID=315347 RepID=A0AAF0PUY9_SOLVR|nr:hypothetical protein MTR67_004651 [Solanum verrucosum]
MSIRCGTADISHEVKDFEGCTFTGCFRFIDSEHVQGAVGVTIMNGILNILSTKSLSHSSRCSGYYVCWTPSIVAV